jgi:6,7-dimethyl-8-ribityllumazine synthase
VSGAGSYLTELEGVLDGRGLRVAVIAARFNAHITDVLLERCVAALHEYGCDPDEVEVIRVPGAWELPQMAARLANGRNWHAIVALGCVIRGDTPHFDFVAGEASRGLGQVAAQGHVPVIFGVLTTENEAQARERAEPAPHGQDKGREAALAALEMARRFSEFAP